MPVTFASLTAILGFLCGLASLVTLFLKLAAATRASERHKAEVEARLKAVELRNVQQDKLMIEANDRIHADHDQRIANLEDRIVLKLDRLIDKMDNLDAKVNDLAVRVKKLEELSIEAVTRFEEHKTRTSEKIADLKAEDELLHRRVSKVRDKSKS